VVHGVSIANRLNIDSLSSSAEIDIIQEQTRVDSIGQASFVKFTTLFSSISRIWKQSRTKEYQFFYMVVSLSLLGIFKTLIALYFASIKPPGLIVIHLHRGDFNLFYKRHWINRVLVWLCFRRVDRLIVLSENQKQEMAGYFPVDSIYAVENSVLEEKSVPIFPDKTTFSNQFVFISNYIKAKGIYDLVSAFSYSIEASLECYGAFNDNELQLKALQTDNVKVNSSIGGLAKFEVIYNAGALILPSWNEGQPTIILEAMMMGTPVLTTKVGLITELLGEDYPFYFEPREPQDLAACIIRFLQYEDKAELSKKMKECYFDFYSQASHKEKLFKAFGISE